MAVGEFFKIKIVVSRTMINFTEENSFPLAMVGERKASGIYVKHR
jgi:hypothetical protein